MLRELELALYGAKNEIFEQCFAFGRVASFESCVVLKMWEREFPEPVITSEAE